MCWIPRLKLRRGTVDKIRSLSATVSQDNISYLSGTRNLTQTQQVVSFMGTGHPHLSIDEAFSFPGCPYSILGISISANLVSKGLCHRSSANHYLNFIP